MLLELIQQSNSKTIINQVIDYVGNNQQRLDELMRLFLGDHMRISQRSSWAVGHIGEQQPQLFDKYHPHLIEHLRQPHAHNAIKRNIVRMYQFIEIPYEYEGKLYEIALNFLLDSNEAIAVKAFSMHVCERIAIKYTDLIPELMDAIVSVLPNASSGVKNRGKHVLNRLIKLSASH